MRRASIGHSSRSVRGPAWKVAMLSLFFVCSFILLTVGLRSTSTSIVARVFYRHYTGNMHCSTGAIPLICTIQSALYRKHALFNRRYTLDMHYSIGTIPETCTVQPALPEICTAVQPASIHETCTVQPALCRKHALFNRHHKGNMHYSTCIIQKICTVQPALFRKKCTIQPAL